MRESVLMLLLGIMASGIALGAEPKVRRRIENCINGGFENGLKQWQPSEKGVSLDLQVKHSGQAAAKCVCARLGDQAGITQHIVFDQKEAIPVVFSAWSKAENVQGRKGPHYSLWCDVEYQNDLRPGRVDDCHIVPFDPAKPGWQRVRTIFTPKSPIKHVNFHLLFRNAYTGTVWFDSASAVQFGDSPLRGEPRSLTPAKPAELPPPLLKKVPTLKADEALVFIQSEQEATAAHDSVKLLVNGEAVGEGAEVSGNFSLRVQIPGGHGTPIAPYSAVRVLGAWDKRRILIENAPPMNARFRLVLLLPHGIRVRQILFEEWNSKADAISLRSFQGRVLVNIQCSGLDGLQRLAMYFGEAKTAAPLLERPRPATFPLTTDDGLRVELGTDGAIWGVSVDGHDLTAPEAKQFPFGLTVGDAAEGKFLTGQTTVAPEGKKTTVTIEYPAADLVCYHTYVAGDKHIRVVGEIADRRESDRMVDALFRLPVAAPDLEWWDDLSMKKKITNISCESEGLTFACVTSEGAGGGVALALAPHLPCNFTLGYEPKESLLNVRMKYGLSPAAKQKQKAGFELSIFRVGARWGLREAAQRYYDLYPEAFARRATKEGMWLFAIPTAKVPNPQDYAYHEGGPHGADLDEKLGILTFPYIIPGQRSVQGLAKLPADYDEAMKAVAEFQVPPKYAWGQDIKSIVENCAVVAPDEKFPITIRDDVGADIKPPKPVNMVVFPVNCDPDLFHDKDIPTVAKFEFEKVRQMLVEQPLIDGIYVDSGSGWVSRFLNVRRDHFAYADYPLTYDEHTGRLAIDGRFTMVEFLKALGDLLHPSNRLLFPNLGCTRKVPWHYFVCDVCGLEGRAVDIPSLRYFRTLAYQKPALRLDYMGLLGNETQLSTRQGLEEYFKRCTLFGIYPSIGRRCDEAYQKFPDLYKTYMPILRKLGAAGWQPITHATCDDPDILLERFGPKEGRLFYTLYNNGPQKKSVQIRINLNPLRVQTVLGGAEFVEGTTVPAGMEATIAVDAGGLRVVELQIR